MRQKAERHAGFQRGQTVISPRDSEVEIMREKRDQRGSKVANGGGLTTGSKLRSGIILTFPEDQEPLSSSEGERGRRRGGGSSHRGQSSDQIPARRDSSSGEQRPNSGRTPRQNRGLTSPSGPQHAKQGPPSPRQGLPSPVQSRRQPRGGGQPRRGGDGTETLTDKMKEMKILQAEKEMAEEQARQAEAQAQALIEERSRIKAEKEQLQRSHNEMAARLQLLEGIISDSEEDYPSPHDAHEGHFPTSVEVLE